MVTVFQPRRSPLTVAAALAFATVLTFVAVLTSVIPSGRREHHPDQLLILLRECCDHKGCFAAMQHMRSIYLNPAPLS